MSYKIKLGITLFLLGLLGVLTLLTISFPLDSLPKELIDKLSPQTIQLLILINPLILLSISVTVGIALFDKVKLSVPTISGFITKQKNEISFFEQLKYGVILGTIAGLFTTIIVLVFKSSIPQEFIELGNNIKITTIARFGYGGLTEEILMRFGFMTFVIWITFKLTKKLNNTTYWTGIILSTIIFSIGHFPTAYSAVGNPSVSLLAYIFIGNSVAGIFFGWLFWKKGLEAAFIGHILTHVIVLLAENFLQLQ